MEPIKNLCIDDTLAHHWNIEPAKMGRPSKGICIKCDTVKSFNNSTWIDNKYSWISERNRRKEALLKEEASTTVPDKVDK